MATNKKPKLKLVKFSGEWFPGDKASFEALKSVGMTVFRLQDSILHTMEVGLLKRFSIEKVPFAEVYKETLKVFEKERLSSIKSYRMQVESNTINLSAPYEHLPKLDQCVTELQFVLGRYGVKVARSNSKVLKDSEGKPYRTALRLECKADPDISPSAFWKDPVAPVQEVNRFNLSPCAALVFTSRPSVAHKDRHTLGVAFEDLLGGEWVQAFSREFNLQGMSEEQLTGAISFFTHLLNVRKNFKPPVTPPTNTR